ncbi:MAG: YncE family protein [Agromyces sp.]
MHIRSTAVFAAVSTLVVGLALPAAADTVTDTTIPTSDYPSNVTVSPDSNRAYVTTMSDGPDHVYVINTDTDAVIGSPIAVGGWPTKPIVSPDSGTVYVPNAASSTLSIIDAQANTVSSTVTLQADPADGIITTDGKKLIVIEGSVTSSLSVINLEASPITDSGTPIPLGGVATSIVLGADGVTAWVALKSTDQVVPVNIETGSVGSPIAVGTAPSSVRLNPTGSLLYVTNNQGDSITVIDTATRTVFSTIALPAGSGPIDAVVTPDGRRVYVASLHSPNLTVINSMTNQIVSTVALGSSANATSLDVTPDGSTLYVANGADSNVRSVDLDVFPSIDSETLADGAAGLPYGELIEFGGSPEPVMSLTSGALPPGLTLAADGVLSGTPTQVGTFTFEVTATNTTSGITPATAAKSLTVTIRDALELTPGFQVGSVAANAVATVRGTALKPNTAWSVEFHSTPLVIASGTTDANGSFAGTAHLPVSVTPGAHKVILSGTSPSGAALSRTVYITVNSSGVISYLSTTASEADSQLAMTGSEPAPLLLTALLLGAAGCALVIRRRTNMA